MKPIRQKNESGPDFTPSRLVHKFSREIVEAAASDPVIDVGCGSGRNAIALSQLGCDVICVDRDIAGMKSSIEHLRKTGSNEIAGRLSVQQLDLAADKWQFPRGFAGGIVSVHFLLPNLITHFERTLRAGGYLVLETVPGHGGNYLELPTAGEIRDALEKTFEIGFYQERKAGPAKWDAVTVQTLACKR